LIVSNEALMDTSQVAHYLNMHPKTIVSMVERGELKAYKVGRHWRYRKSDIDAFLEQRQNIRKTDEADTKGDTDEQAEEPK
jgi:excisionase family DNA binding protein